MDAKQDLLSIITAKPGITYNDLIQASKYSPSTIYSTLCHLKKDGKVKPIPYPTRKAKGWVITEAL